MLRAVGDELVRADVRRLALAAPRVPTMSSLLLGLGAGVDGRAAGPQAVVVVVGIDEDLVEVRFEEVARLFALEVPPLGGPEVVAHLAADPPPGAGNARR